MHFARGSESATYVKDALARANNALHAACYEIDGFSVSEHLSGEIWASVADEYHQLLTRAASFAQILGTNVRIDEPQGTTRHELQTVTKMLTAAAEHAAVAHGQLRSCS